ncbi:phosphoenolpyruvate--protein phosphotransferase [Mariprofundus erugo]|uniref:phosphoenolpyruvate--protein phosphotransferase n=1 Tax=Mariprofundus erugo TaxID=2528639 RepID=UPI001EE95D52|nr:phosphoenolpyruvate--protein phosphotransferase [Mariprofundus erugo]
MEQYCPPLRPRSEGRAVAGSSGIIIGRVKKLSHGLQPIPERRLATEETGQEIRRLQLAVEAAITEIDQQRLHLRQLGSQDPLMVLDAHRMMIADPELTQQAISRINSECINAEWALRQQMDAIQQLFREFDNAYLRGREDDIEQVGQRILCQLMQRSHELPADLVPDSEEQQPLIFVGEDFNISDIVRMWRQGISGIVTEQGGVDAHNIIVARGIGLPALIGAAGILDEMEDGDLLILDAEQRQWILNPPQEEQTGYSRFIEAVTSNRRGLAAYAMQPSRSLNGREMRLMANIEFIEELDVADQIGIDGIGLFRSEFLFLNCKLPPDEEQQYRYYAAIIRRMAGKPVTMRLLDIGGDKSWLQQQDQHEHISYGGNNPSLGLRGIRLLLRCRQLLTTQLRAMLRAGEEGPLHILVPMVSNCDEMQQVRALAMQIRKELGLQSPLSIGTMIEVPAAVMIADDLAKVSDFFSIGTNDLIQYTLAVDRSDEGVADLYQPDHPAIQKLIYQTALAAKHAGIPISVCGELAAHPDWTETFLNLDMHALSMSLHNILPVRRLLSRQVYTPLLPQR